MTETERFLSSSWYRIASLKPCLRQHVVVRMHRYRGQLWYVISDGLHNRVHRISPAAYVLVAAMDGTRTLQALWSEAAVSLGEQAPTQDNVIQLLGQLHNNDLITGDVPPDSRALFERQGQLNRSKFLQWVLNPLALRIPLVDPNHFLTMTLPFARPLLGKFGAALWLATVLPALLLAAQFWPELTENIGDRVLPPHNLLLIAAIYPIIKLLHELGHGYTTRAHGGEVHELGIMLLVLLPMPYVEVSAAAGFRSKWTRCLVGAGGILVEIFIAALALYVWLLVEPGFVRAVAFNVMLTASVSSLLFNGNPLLRYDGYYVLSDLIEVPNLAQRGRQYWSHLGRRYLLGTRGMREFPAVLGERIWFLLYTPIASVYRMTVTIGIALFLMSTYLVAGMALALWGVVAGVVVPITRGLWSVVTSPVYARNRGRAVLTTGGLIAAGLAFLLWLPAPMHTEAEGVVWLPERAIVRAGTPGFMKAILASPGTLVSRGQVVIESEDPELATHVAILRYRAAELMAKLDAIRFTDRIEATVTEIELASIRTELVQQSALLGTLNAQAETDGLFVINAPEDAPGRFNKRGEILGYVLPREGGRIIRAAVSQENIDLVRHHIQAAQIKLADRLDQAIEVRTIHEVPSGKDQLPSAAMGTAGGGSTTVDPRDVHGLTSLNRIFLVDLELAAPVVAAGFGGRAYVRFDHDWEPLGAQLWRRARQLLLSRVQI